MTCALISCSKEAEDDLSGGGSAGGNNSNPPTPSTLVISHDSFVSQLYYCTFTYYDVNGDYHQAESNMDRTVENVDFERDFKVEAQAGITLYDPVNGPILNPQHVNWQLKKDGFVIDARGATSYIYQN